MYSVFGMLELPDSHVGNPHSGKVNFHAQGEVGDVVAEFDGWLYGVLEMLANESNESKAAGDLLPPIFTYSKYIQMAMFKFKITSNQARDRYGLFTMSQWDALLRGSNESTKE